VTHAWVIGSSGLLGAAVVRALRKAGVDVFQPAEPFNWQQPVVLGRQLAVGVLDFARYALAGSQWQIYWAAGIGTMGSTDSDLLVERQALDRLLQAIAQCPDLVDRQGAIAFASSAGAIYAGAGVDIIDERTMDAPTTPYARAKLAQETSLRRFSDTSRLVHILIARLSTIYGPGQARGKQQGLLAHMARSVVCNRPIQIYVPFDTIRDYIFVDDAAAAMVAHLSVPDDRPQVTTRIIAGEQPTTIAEIVGAFRRVARRAPRIVTSASKLGALYSRRIQFRSVGLPVPSALPKTSLLIGIAQLLAAERVLFASSPPERERFASRIR